MKTLVMTDNTQLLDLARELKQRFPDVDIAQSPGGGLEGIAQVDVAQEIQQLVAEYHLVLSLHCQQIFPAELLRSLRCINLHPGYNPCNRGWYPHVFSIINGLPAGVTLHEMDERIDHGPVIARRQCPIEPWDTSETLYARLLKIERDLVLEYFPRLLKGDYCTQVLEEEGNLNTRRDFESLCRIEPDRMATYQQVLDHLRALTHGEYRNAWFVDEQGRRVYVRVVLEPETGDDMGSVPGSIPRPPA